MSNEQAFKDLVMQYVEVSDKIAATAQLRKTKTELGKQITEYMKANNIAQLNLRDGGSLLIKESKAVAPVKKEDITEKFSTRVGYEAAEQIVTDLWTNRPVTTKEALKLVKPKDT